MNRGFYICMEVHQVNKINDQFFSKYGIRILLALRRIIRAIDIYSHKLNTEYRITGPQLICLYSIVKDGPLTLSYLSKHYSLSASTITGIIDRLEAKGLIERQRNNPDRRKIMITSTEAGIELVANAPSPLQDRLTEAISNLPALEQAAIVLSLEKIVELMDADHLDASAMLVKETEIQPSKDGI